MNLSRFLPGLQPDAADDRPLTEEELAEAKRERHRHAPKHGPQKVRWMTSGQVRRAQIRFSDARSRKANKAFRRQWMDNEAAYHTLTSQLALLATRPDSALAPGVRRVLEQRYDDVEAAQTAWVELTSERLGSLAAANAFWAEIVYGTDIEDLA